MSMSGAVINTGMGMLGGGVGGKFNNIVWYGRTGTAFPEFAARQQMLKTIQANTTPATIGQGIGGSLIGNITEIPCLTCKPKCE